MKNLHSRMGFFEMAIKLYYLSLGLRLRFNGCIAKCSSDDEFQLHWGIGN